MKHFQDNVHSIVPHNHAPSLKVSYMAVLLQRMYNRRRAIEYVADSWSSLKLYIRIDEAPRD